MMARFHFPALHKRLPRLPKLWLVSFPPNSSLLQNSDILFKGFATLSFIYKRKEKKGCCLRISKSKGIIGSIWGDKGRREGGGGCQGRATYMTNAD